MERTKQERLLDLLKEKETRLKYNKIDYYFPDENGIDLLGGVIHARELYPRHIEFFTAGKDFQERIFMAGNRTGKTFAGACEVAYHATGKYPSWWVGKKFTHPVKIWVAGHSAETTRDVLQLELLGAKNDMGTGTIPKDCIVGEPTAKPGTPNGVDNFYIRHITGGTSHMSFKSYEKGVKAFKGTNIHVVWLDEESPPEVYTECVIRTAKIGGIVLITFTPDDGLSETVLKFFKDGQVKPGAHGFKWVSMVSWDDVPHITPEDYKRLEAEIPPYQRQAKKHGIPYLGAGAVYPIAEEDIVCEPFKIPEWWPRVFGLDVGWNKTAAIWGALDPETDVLYLYDEYYRGQAEPASHAHNIKLRGDWIPGVIDPASRGRSQKDGSRLFYEYSSEYQLNISPAKNAVDTGLHLVYTRMTSQKLKIFKNLVNTLGELRIYRRKQLASGKVEIVKEHDHLMDAMRYLVISGLNIAETNPILEEGFTERMSNLRDTRDPITGY